MTTVEGLDGAILRLLELTKQNKIRWKVVSAEPGAAGVYAFTNGSASVQISSRDGDGTFPFLVEMLRGTKRVESKIYDSDMRGNATAVAQAARELFVRARNSIVGPVIDEIFEGLE